jgi:hypothetical protein
LGFLFGGQMIDTDRIQLDKLQKFNQLPPIKVLDIVDQKDGTARVSFDLSLEFRKKYKESFGLKKWSDKHFEKTIAQALEEYLNKVKTDNRQVQNPDFLWTQPGENNE